MRHFSNKPTYLYQPTFWEYEHFAKEGGSSVSRIVIDHSRGVFESLDETIQSLDPGVVVLGNPNNPTGDLLSTDEVIALASRYPDHTFVIDETYLWFVGEYDSLTAARHVQRQPNVVVIASFSKVCSLPGLRVGLVFAHNELLEQILKGKAPYSVLPIQVEVVRYIFSSCKAFLDASRKSAERDRKAIVRYLETRPQYEYMPPQANFIFICAERTGLAAHMLQGGVRVRDGSEFGEDYARYIRMRLCEEEGDDWKKVIALLDEFA